MKVGDRVKGWINIESRYHDKAGVIHSHNSTLTRAFGEPVWNIAWDDAVMGCTAMFERHLQLFSPEEEAKRLDQQKRLEHAMKYL